MWINTTAKVRQASSMLGLAGALALSACGSAAAVDDELVTRTIVQVRNDGTYSVRLEQVTLAEQRADIAAREALQASEAANQERVESVTSALTLDASCSDASSWFFDRPNLSGRQLCLIGAGNAELSSYPRYGGTLDTDWPYNHDDLGTWKSSIRSYWVGASGAFLKSYWRWPLASNWVPFAYWERNDNVTVPYQSVYLNF